MIVTAIHKCSEIEHINAEAEERMRKRKPATQEAVYKVKSEYYWPSGVKHEEESWRLYLTDVFNNYYVAEAIISFCPACGKNPEEDCERKVHEIHEWIQPVRRVGFGF